MRRLLCAALLLATLPARAIDIPGVSIPGAHDGDTTLRVDISTYPDETHSTTIRVRGINAPEINSLNPCEKAAAVVARDGFADWLQGHTVTLRNVTWYKFGGEIVADLLRDDGRDYATDAIAARKVVPYTRDEKRELWPPCQVPPKALPQGVP